LAGNLPRHRGVPRSPQPFGAQFRSLVLRVLVNDPRGGSFRRPA